MLALHSKPELRVVEQRLVAGALARRHASTASAAAEKASCTSPWPLPAHAYDQRYPALIPALMAAPWLKSKAAQEPPGAVRGYKERRRIGATDRGTTP